MFRICGRFNAMRRESLPSTKMAGRIGAEAGVRTGSPIAFAKAAHFRDRNALIGHLHQLTLPLPA